MVTFCPGDVALVWDWQLWNVAGPGPVTSLNQQGCSGSREVGSWLRSPPSPFVAELQSCRDPTCRAVERAGAADESA